jgi:hypothetical protein
MADSSPAFALRHRILPPAGHILSISPVITLTGIAFNAVHQHHG